MDEMKTWGRLSNDERREVIKFMKRRTKYGEWDLKRWAISAAVVVAGWALITFVVRW